MIRRICLLSVILGFSFAALRAQNVAGSSGLFPDKGRNTQEGRLTITQNPEVDTLLNRYILGYKHQEEKNGYDGIEGFRIQIYNSSDRNAKEESAKVRQEFMNQFPEIVSYLIFAEPAYYKVRVGNFRSRTEAIKLYLKISRKFPNADMVPDIINLQDLNNK